MPVPRERRRVHFGTETPAPPTPDLRREEQEVATEVGWPSAVGWPTGPAAPFTPSSFTSSLSSSSSFTPSPQSPARHLIPLLDEVLLPGGPLEGWDMLCENYKKRLDEDQLNSLATSPGMNSITVTHYLLPQPLIIEGYGKFVTVGRLLDKMTRILHEAMSHDDAVIAPRECQIACGMRIQALGLSRTATSLAKIDWLRYNVIFQGFQTSGLQLELLIAGPRD
ncbi:hypothetical protein DL96DRAFT_1717228 [Flagelloscypha sp. PMI_526]|nr:hypothetical protein DL96DRAFT_1717228 [Flagelloscypha sp. PMI_526]